MVGSTREWLQRIGAAQSIRVHTLWALFSSMLFIGGMVIGYVLHPPIPEPTIEDGFPLAHCTRIIDGDTIEVQFMGQTERVRILGIDAPETRRTRSLRAQAKLLKMDPEVLLGYGEIATRTVENWLLDRHVRLIFPEDQILRDNFGRLLCYVELQGTDIGERLLLGGNAITYEAPHPRQESYHLFEAEARNKRRGIWRNLS